MIERVFGVVVTTEVGPLDEAVEGVGAADIEGLDGARAADVLVELRRVRAKLAAVEARLVARVDGERPWAEAGYLGTAAWLAASDHTSLDEARADVRLARRLRSMPATAAALAAGDITFAHARRLATLNAPDTAAAFGEAEEFLVGQARSMRWADFAKACGYWLRQARRDKDPDPDKSDRDHRKVSLHDGLRGTGLLSGELTPTAKAEVRSELDRLERRLFEADWAAAKAVHGEAVTVAHLARTPAQRRHDALAEMARRSATAPADGKRPKPAADGAGGRGRLPQRARGGRRHPDLARDRGRSARRGRHRDDAVRGAVPGPRPRPPTQLRGRGPPGRRGRAPHLHRRGLPHPLRPVRDRPHPPVGRRAAPPCPRTAGPNAGPTIDNTTGPPQPHRDHHPRPTSGHRLTGAASLELARARIRDRLLHDPAWGALADARDDDDWSAPASFSD